MNNSLTKVIVRVDDIGGKNQQAEALILAFCKLGVKVTCAVVPYWLTSDCIDFMVNISKQFPGLIEVHQHGYAHINYSDAGEEYEFGPNRTFEQQRSDILAGRRVLEKFLGRLFSPVFTPPYNAFDENTLLALRQAQYCGISSYADHDPSDLLPEYSPDIDCFEWHPTREKKWDNIVLEWRNSSHLKLRGFILHPRFMELDNIPPFVDNLASLINKEAISVTFSSINQSR